MENLELKKAKLEGEVFGLECILASMHDQPLEAQLNEGFKQTISLVELRVKSAEAHIRRLSKMTYKVENPITGSKFEGQEIDIVDNGIFIAGLFFDAKVYNFYKQLPGEIHFVDVEIGFV